MRAERLLGSTSIEVIVPVSRRRIRSALFDFDGTLSLIREGWQEVMIHFMVEVLGELKSGESEGELRGLVEDFIVRLTGKQTIYQMLRLAEEVETRAGTPQDPVAYKHQYHRRLRQRIQSRIGALESGRNRPEDWLVPGSLAILENLRRRGVTLYLASGTDETFVRREADLLGLTGYFGEHVYGALDEYQRFSKRLLIQQIFTQQRLQGQEFVAFGDGYVEIENTKQAGGLAVGVASDESRREGIDRWKRRRLIEAGADLIIPDFREQEALVGYLFGEA